MAAAASTAMTVVVEVAAVVVEVAEAWASKVFLPFTTFSFPSSFRDSLFERLGAALSSAIYHEESLKKTREPRCIKTY